MIAENKNSLSGLHDGVLKEGYDLFTHRGVWGLPIVTREAAIDQSKAFFEWFHALSDEEQVHIFMQTHTCWQFEKICKNRKAAYNTKYNAHRQRIRPAQLRNSYTLEEVITLLNEYKNPYHRAAFIWQLYTCTRISEVNTIRRLGKDLLEITTSKTKNRGRGRKIVPIHGVLWDILHTLSWVEKRSKSYLKNVQVMTLRSLGDDFNPIHSYSRPTAKHPEGRPMYQFSTHSARYTATDWCGEAGMDPFYIALFRGDDPKLVLGMQGHYRQFKPEKLRECLDEVFFSLNDYLKRNSLLIHMEPL